MAGDQRFRKQERLRLRGDFARVFAAKRRAADELLIVYVAGNGLKWSRLGMSVSRRVGNAVTRNYLRRRLREAFRTVKCDLPTGLDIVCVARSEACNPHRDICKALPKLVARATRQHQGKQSNNA